MTINIHFPETCPICGQVSQVPQIHQHGDGSWIRTEDFWRIRVERKLDEILALLKANFSMPE